MSKAQKLLTAFALHDAGMEMKRLQIARRNKNASKEELEQLFQDWLKKQKLSCGYVPSPPYRI